MFSVQGYKIFLRIQLDLVGCGLIVNLFSAESPLRVFTSPPTSAPLVVTLFLSFGLPAISVTSLSTCS